MTKGHLSNAAYSLLDYAAQPASMLIAAPVLLHHLGMAGYGVWLIASAAAGAGSIVSSGFGDAVIQRVALLKAREDMEGVVRVVRTMLTINLALGSLVAAGLWLLVPCLAGRMTQRDPGLHSACLWSLRIGAALIVVKSVESIFISTQRACLRYAPAVRIGLAIRLLSVAASVAVVLAGHGVVALMLLTALLGIVGAVVHGAALGRHLGTRLVRPQFDGVTARQLFSYGGFTWLQALSGVLFSQADRLILGTMLGASAVACYGVSVQMAQPIHGLTAAGLHFLFPHLASRSATMPRSVLRGTLLKAFGGNLLSATTLTATVIFCGPWVLGLWMGPSLAAQSAPLLPLIGVSFGLLALNVTAHYALMALGRVRAVTAVNVVGGLLMLLTVAGLVPVFGVRGAAMARLCYGPVTCLLYLPLLGLMREAAQAPVRRVQPEMRQA